MLIDQLHLPVSAQQHTEIVEPGDVALQLHPIDQVDRDGGLTFTNGIQERILKILRLIVNG